MPSETFEMPIDIPAWCERALGSQPEEQLFATGHLSLVVGYRLTDKRNVVVKVRKWHPRLIACTRVHKALVDAGFCAPEPLAGPQEIGGLAVSAEMFVEGEQLPLTDDSAIAFAGELARLIAMAPPPEAAGNLSPSPPWVAWDHTDSHLWPAPDDRAGDLNAIAELLWLNQLAIAVRDRMSKYLAPKVVGHGDWYSANLHWKNDRLVAVHDWDSVVAQPEAALVGQAAIAWPGTGGPAEVASIKQSEDFIAGYVAHSRREWRDDDYQAMWAAGLWQRAFDAKKALLVGEDPDDILSAEEAGERARRAGLSWPGSAASCARSR